MNKHFRFLSLLFSLFGLALPASWISAQQPTLFVLFDAGEAHALAPVILAMEADQDPYKVLAVATARQEIRRYPIPQQHMLKLLMEDGEEFILDRQWDHHFPVSPSIIKRTLGRLDPHVVVAGMVSEVQRYVCEYFQSRDVRILGLYDNLYYDLSHFPNHDVVAQVAAHCDLVLVPSQPIADSFPVPTAVVGQPSLEYWQQALSVIERETVRKQLNLDESPLLLFCGDYAGGYTESFRLFCDCLHFVSGWTVAIRPHPKMGSDWERFQLRQAGLSHVRIFDGPFTTISCVAAADVIICHRSSVGMQATFAGKSVVCISAHGQGMQQPLIEQGLIPLVQSPTALTEVLHALQPPDIGKVHHITGIPSDAVARIRRIIQHKT